jgi:hypothetical protein
VKGAVPHQPGGGGIPEGRRAAVAECHLVALGQSEELAEAVSNAGDQVTHGSLAVRGAHHLSALSQGGKRLRADLRGPAAEAAVGGLELGRDLD